MRAVPRAPSAAGPAASVRLSLLQDEPSAVASRLRRDKSALAAAQRRRDIAIVATRERSVWLECSMALPLLTRATPDGLTFALTRRTVPTAAALQTATAPVAAPLALRSGDSERMPTRVPGPGEQYRFHFDMKKCIGCKCCVVACNEQNGNPASINWRRVGELEGGFFPHAVKNYLSMGCNHCLEPTCLAGCPVDAYSKDPVTGIVHHSADTCIG